MLTFPVGLFPPQSQTWRLVGASVGGPVSLSGVTQFGEFSGGGHWEAQLEKSPLWTRQTFKLWEAAAAYADGGAMPYVVPVCDRRRQPFAVTARPPGSLFDDDTIYTDGASWTDTGITATLTGSAALRATQLSFNYSGDNAPIGGEHFCIWHGSGAQRLYRIARMISYTAGVVTAIIRPGLREACGPGLALDFNNPRCQMRVDGDMAAQLEMLKRGTGSVKFVEDFQPYANFIFPYA